MTQDTHDVADRGRRLLLSTGGAALALGAVGTAHADARPTTPTYAISRTRYSTAASAFLPTAGDYYALPLATVVFTDGNQDSTLNADNSITINTAGNYRILLAADWSPGKGHDAALRTYGMRRRPAGSPPLTTTPGGALTLIVDTDEHLSSQDVPGSATPKTARFPKPVNGSQDTYTPFPWTPGTIAAGGSVSVDVTLPIPGYIAPGDAAVAALTSITDATVGAAAVAGLMFSAKPISQDVVRVSLLNTTTAAITVPQGNLTVLAMSTTQITGGSAEGRTILATTTLALNAGDMVYAIFGSLTPGDVMQSTSEVFVQVEKWVQTS